MEEFHRFDNIFLIVVVRLRHGFGDHNQCGAMDRGVDIRVFAEDSLHQIPVRNIRLIKDMAARKFLSTGHQ